MKIPGGMRSALAVVVASACTFALSARAQNAPATVGTEPDDDAVVEVGGAQRSLPRVTFVPGDRASLDATNELGRLVALTGLYRSAVTVPGAPAGGLSVRILYATDANGGRLEIDAQRLDGTVQRRVVAVRVASRALDFARAADGIVADLSGTASHLAGQLLFTDASVPGERRVRVMLGEGTAVRDVSPAGMVARGADVGPGGFVHFAGAHSGEPMRLFAESDAQPIALDVPGFVQSVAFTADRMHVAVVTGSAAGDRIYAGAWGGTLRAVDTGTGIVVGIAYGPNGELAYASGPADGPLRVMVDGNAISPAGAWVSAPSFCPRDGHNRVVYSVRSGAGHRVMITDLATHETREITRGGSPACSPDGRTVAVARAASGREPAGVWLVGEDGIAEHRIHQGEVTGLRWFAASP